MLKMTIISKNTYHIEMEDIMKRSYMIIIHKDSETNDYWAECPAIPHVHAQADSIEELTELMKEAIEFHLESIGMENLPEEKIFSTVISLEVQNA